MEQQQSDVPGFSFMDAEGSLQASTGMAGMAVLPGAPITTYSVSHETKIFDSATMGSLPGVALFVAMSEVIEE